MSSDPILQANSISKSYLIYNNPQDRLKQMFMPRLVRALGGQPRSYFKEHWALRDVSLSVGRGETVGIIGRNGSGKSTLLQIICGTLSPSSGQVSARGRVAALLELGAGFNPEFTGRQNAILNAQILGLSESEIADKIGEIEAFADIGPFFDHAVKTYSSGMFVRVAFAVQAHVQPDILIVDEALAVGDAAFQAKCLARIRHLQEQGTSILLVSHSAATLIEFCDRAIYLDKGVVRLDGSCRDVVELYSNDIVESENGVQRTSVQERSRNPLGQPGLVVEDKMIDAPRTEIVEVNILDGTGRSKQTFTYGDEIIIDARVVFHEENSEPCFGIQITSADGVPLYSATTENLLHQPTSAAPNEVRTIRWQLRANFGGARYIIALGAGEISRGEYKRHFRLAYAGHFDVLPEPHAGSGWLAPKTRFSDSRLQMQTPPSVRASFEGLGIGK